MAGLSIASMVLQGIGDLIKGFNGTDEVKDVSNGFASALQGLATRGDNYNKFYLPLSFDRISISLVWGFGVEGLECGCRVLRTHTCYK